MKVLCECGGLADKEPLEKYYYSSEILYEEDIETKYVCRECGKEWRNVRRYIRRNQRDF